MSKYNVYTALIGILSVFFMLAIWLSKFSFAIKAFFFVSVRRSSDTVL